MPSKCAYPYPVYQAHYDNGFVARWSIYVPERATAAQMALRGRELAEGFAKPAIDIGCNEYVPFNQAAPYQIEAYGERTAHRFIGATLIAGYVEDIRHPGQAWHVDDLSASVAAKPRRVTKKDWQATLAKVLEQAGNGGLKADTIAAAQLLLAA